MSDIYGRCESRLCERVAIQDPPLMIALLGSETDQLWATADFEANPTGEFEATFVLSSVPQLGS